MTDHITNQLDRAIAKQARTASRSQSLIMGAAIAFNKHLVDKHGFPNASQLFVQGLNDIETMVAAAKKAVIDAVGKDHGFKAAPDATLTISEAHEAEIIDTVLHRAISAVDDKIAAQKREMGAAHVVPSPPPSKMEA